MYLKGKVIIVLDSESLTVITFHLLLKQGSQE